MCTRKSSFSFSATAQTKIRTTLGVFVAVAVIIPRTDKSYPIEWELDIFHEEVKIRCSAQTQNFSLVCKFQPIIHIHTYLLITEFKNRIGAATNSVHASVPTVVKEHQKTQLQGGEYVAKLYLYL